MILPSAAMPSARKALSEIGFALSCRQGMEFPFKRRALMTPANKDRADPCSRRQENL